MNKRLFYSFIINFEFRSLNSYISLKVILTLSNRYRRRSIHVIRTLVLILNNLIISAAKTWNIYTQLSICLVCACACQLFSAGIAILFCIIYLIQNTNESSIYISLDINLRQSFYTMNQKTTPLLSSLVNTHTHIQKTIFSEGVVDLIIIMMRHGVKLFQAIFLKTGQLNFVIL